MEQVQAQDGRRDAPASGQPGGFQAVVVDPREALAEHGRDVRTVLGTGRRNLRVGFDEQRATGLPVRLGSGGSGESDEDEECTEPADTHGTFPSGGQDGRRTEETCCRNSGVSRALAGASTHSWDAFRDSGAAVVFCERSPVMWNQCSKTFVPVLRVQAEQVGVGRLPKCCRSSECDPTPRGRSTNRRPGAVSVEPRPDGFRRCPDPLSGSARDRPRSRGESRPATSRTVIGQSPSDRQPTIATWQYIFGNGMFAHLPLCRWMKPAWGAGSGKEDLRTVRRPSAPQQGVRGQNPLHRVASPGQALQSSRDPPAVRPCRVASRSKPLAATQDVRSEGVRRQHTPAAIQVQDADPALPSRPARSARNASAPTSA